MKKVQKREVKNKNKRMKSNQQVVKMRDKKQL